MHRVHHSTIVRETDSNYGFNLSIWDRIFSTYNDQPELGHDKMIIGIDEWQDENPTKIGLDTVCPIHFPKEKVMPNQLGLQLQIPMPTSRPRMGWVPFCLLNGLIKSSHPFVSRFTASTS